ncbi:MAG: twin-arginine translocation signal domain-containing protein [Desulfobulbaceae bacterium]|nr:twin-arginine translocation signal domain-containing protein [Desulfobulbaceae bacterium]
MKKKVKDSRRSFLKHVIAGTAVVAGTTTIARPAKAKSATKPNQLDETSLP